MTLDRASENPVIETVVFDLGGVLIDWDPRHLYRKIFDDEAAMERFLAEVCNRAWIESQDEGRSAADATAELLAKFPHHWREIEVYHARWPETMGGAIEETVALLEQLAARGHDLFVVSNFSHETFPHALERFDFWHHFDGLVISGREGVKKPNPKIFDVLIERHDLDPARSLFIDDVPANVEAARGCGLHSHHFTGAQDLRKRLEAERLL